MGTETALQAETAPALSWTKRSSGRNTPRLTLSGLSAPLQGEHPSFEESASTGSPRDGKPPAGWEERRGSCTWGDSIRRRRPQEPTTWLPLCARAWTPRSTFRGTTTCSTSTCFGIAPRRSLWLTFAGSPVPSPGASPNTEVLRPRQEVGGEDWSVQREKERFLWRVRHGGGGGKAVRPCSDHTERTQRKDQL